MVSMFSVAMQHDHRKTKDRQRVHDHENCIRMVNPTGCSAQYIGQTWGWLKNGISKRRRK